MNTHLLQALIGQLEPGFNQRNFLLNADQLGVVSLLRHTDEKMLQFFLGSGDSVVLVEAALLQVINQGKFSPDLIKSSLKGYRAESFSRSGW